MLCCPRVSKSAVEDPAAALKRERKRIHDQIEKDLKADEKRRQREHRILLLGCGEAGKSTFIKQMRIIHSDGFSDDERRAFKSDIADNILSAIHTLLQNIAVVEGGEDEFDEDDVRAVEALPAKMRPEMLLPYAERIRRLWESDAVQVAYRNRARFQLVECAKYFLSRVETVLRPDYLPSNQDIVQVRVKTTGIIEHDFEIALQGSNKRKLILIDVGGQRSERKKWIHCFEDVMLLLFLTAVSEYDQVLAEDEVTNRMEESLLLFKTILNYQWFNSTNVILFLNKKDVLEEKIESSPVRKYFPDFAGPDCDAAAALDYFGDRFSSLNPNPADRSVYVHATCATDTENIQVVDAVVQDIVMQKILEDTMIN